MTEPELKACTACGAECLGTDAMGDTVFGCGSSVDEDGDFEIGLACALRQRDALRAEVSEMKRESSKVRREAAGLYSQIAALKAELKAAGNASLDNEGEIIALRAEVERFKERLRLAEADNRELENDAKQVKASCARLTAELERWTVDLTAEQMADAFELAKAPVAIATTFDEAFAAVDAAIREVRGKA